MAELLKISQFAKKKKKKELNCLFILLMYICRVILLNLFHKTFIILHAVILSDTELVFFPLFR